MLMVSKFTSPAKIPSPEYRLVYLANCPLYTFTYRYLIDKIISI